VNDRTNDPATIERDLAETRARLSTHLDELTSRLSPGQLVDEGLAYLRNGQGAEFVRKLGADVRDNPLPVALTGLGLAWLAVASTVRRDQPATGAIVPYDQARAWRSTRDDIAERARRAGDAVTRSAEETEDTFRARVAEARARVLGVQRDVAETASAYADRVQQALDAAQNRASETLGRMRDSARDWSEGMAETGRQTSEAVGGALRRSRDYAASAGSGVAETVGDNPLLLAAFGLTAGALLGMMLPKTSQEDAWMGGAAGAVRDTADDITERGTRAAKAAVSAGYEAGRSEAARSVDAPGSRPA
jgi:hypothetical protein